MKIYYSVECALGLGQVRLEFVLVEQMVALILGDGSYLDVKVGQLFLHNLLENFHNRLDGIFDGYRLFQMYFVSYL